MDPVNSTEPLTIGYLQNLQSKIRNEYLTCEGWYFHPEDLKIDEFRYDQKFDFSQLTIGMSLFNRPTYFEPCIKYIAAHFPGSTLIIADSSSDENKNRHRDSIKQHLTDASNINILTKEFPQNISILTPFEYIVMEACTPYFLKWDDDDFYNPIAVYSGMNALNQNNKLVSVNGSSINVLTTESNSRKTFYVSGHFSPEFVLPQLHSRLVLLAIMYGMTWYNLTRTAAYQDSIQSVKYLESSKMDQLWDIAFSLNIAMHGDSHMTNDIFMARRLGGSRISTNKRGPKRDLIYKLIDESESADFYRFRVHFRQTLIEHNPKIPESLADTIVDDISKSIVFGSNNGTTLFRSLNRDLLINALNVNAWTNACDKLPSSTNFLLSTLATINKTD